MISIGKSRFFANEGAVVLVSCGELACCLWLWGWVD
jgi:hypothetical protein